MPTPVLSFCLFGADPAYTHGALRNAELAQTLYPGWRVIIYCGLGIPDDILRKLLDAGVELRGTSLNPMLARFLVNDDPSISRYLIRDTDSRLNAREKEAVDSWVASDKPFHVIRDHPGHRVPIPGGLWGGTPGHFSISSLLASWPGDKSAGHRNAIYNNDQLFLRDTVWPLIQGKTLQHDFCLRDIFKDADPFPARAGDFRFCGERFSADDEPDEAGWQQRINWLDWSAA